MCTSLLACGGVEPKKKPKETEDAIEDVEKKEADYTVFYLQG